MHAELLDETLRENRQEPLRLPRNSEPTTDGRAALHEWYAADVTGRNDDRGRDHRDAVAGSRQSDGGMRSAALEKHARSNARNPARVLEPFTRCKLATEKQKRFVGEFRNLDQATAAEPVVSRNHGDAPHGIEQPNCKTVIIQRHESEMDVAEFQTARHRDPAFFDQLNLHARMPAPIAGEEMRKGIFNDHGRSGHAENSGLTFFERASPLVECLDFSQEATAESKQALSLGGKFQPPTNAVEQRYAESGFERIDLSGSSRLTQIDSWDRAMDAARVDNRHEGPQLIEVYLHDAISASNMRP
jgi:hypothetical protein